MALPRAHAKDLDTHDVAKVGRGATSPRPTPLLVIDCRSASGRDCRECGWWREVAGGTRLAHESCATSRAYQETRPIGHASARDRQCAPLSKGTGMANLLIVDDEPSVLNALRRMCLNRMAAPALPDPVVTTFTSRICPFCLSPPPVSGSLTSARTASTDAGEGPDMSYQEEVSDK